MDPLEDIPFDPHRELGLSPGATRQEIIRAFGDARNKFEVNASTSANCATKFESAKRARDILLHGPGASAPEAELANTATILNGRTIKEIQEHTVFASARLQIGKPSQPNTQRTQSSPNDQIDGFVPWRDDPTIEPSQRLLVTLSKIWLGAATTTISLIRSHWLLKIAKSRSYRSSRREGKRHAKAFRRSIRDGKMFHC